MTGELASLLRAELSQRVDPRVRDFAMSLAQRRGALAVLFYGSALRTRELDGVLDFYLLTGAPHRHGVRGLVERCLWPEVSYHEHDGLRAKAATLTLGTFRAAATGAKIDTTIWARFVQPAALVWAQDAATTAAIEEAVGDCVVTAASFAAVLGPARGPAAAFWSALFRRTYMAEFRVEPPGRERQIISAAPERYDAFLSLGWDAAHIAHRGSDGVLAAEVEPRRRARLRRCWARRQMLGKVLGVARLTKACFTFEGAARYAAWKVERHTGVTVPVGPLAERFPLLAAPGAAWRLWRARRPR